MCRVPILQPFLIIKQAPVWQQLFYTNKTEIEFFYFFLFLMKDIFSLD